MVKLYKVIHNGTKLQHGFFIIPQDTDFRLECTYASEMFKRFLGITLDGIKLKVKQEQLDVRIIEVSDLNEWKG